MKRLPPFVLAAGCLLLIHCMNSGVAGPSPQTLLLSSLAENVALARYQEFEKRSEVMAERVLTLCADLSESGLTAAREAWWDAREPWKYNEIVQFGPVVEYPLRIGPKLDDWPVKPPAIDEAAASDETYDQAAFDAMGSATRGLPVVEYLLWVDGQDTLSKLSATESRCAFLVGASADVAINAKRLREAWQEDWLQPLSDPEAAPGGEYGTTQEIVNEWVNRMAFTIENVRLRKLGKPVGDDAGGQPQPDIIESRYSGRSIQDARDAIAGVRDVWTGEVGEGTLGIKELARKESTRQLIEDLFDEVGEGLAAMKEPLETTIVDDPASIASAQDSLLKLQSAIQNELADEAGVTLSFNDADGD